MQRRRCVAAKGQAAVEMAVLMLVIVPVFLYVLFADELNRHKLDLQEAVVSSPWDYAFLDYESAVSSGALNAKHQNEHWNHSSINPGNKGLYNIADNTFTGPRWMKEVHCQLSKSDDLAMGNSTDIATKFKNRFQQGGKVTCSAQKGVVNFYLVQWFMQEFAGVEMSSKARSSLPPGAIGPQQMPDPAFTWPLAEQNFSIVTDTWALTNTKRVTPNEVPFTARTGCGAGGVLGSVFGGSDDLFYNRMFAIFCEGNKRPQAVDAANKIANEAAKGSFLGGKYLAPHVKEDPLLPGRSGDNTDTPTLAFFPNANGDVKPSQNSENPKFNHSPWTDRYKQMHSARKFSYLGKDLPQQ